MNTLETPITAILEEKYPVYLSAFNRNRAVHVVDTDLSACNALTALFSLEGFQTGCSTSLEHLEATLENGFPDVLLINLSFGFDVLRNIRSNGRGSAIFAISDTQDVNQAVEAMRIGVLGVEVKPIDPERLMRSVRDTLRRDVHITPSGNGQCSVEIRGFYQLTQREREVLQLLVDGLSNKEIGIQLKISPRTVEVHRARIMEKLRARNTADLIRIVLTS